MSLAKAVEEIADQIEKDALESRESKEMISWACIQLYARQLRSAVKAAESEAGSSPSEQHVAEIAKARQEFRKEGHAESFPTTAILVGGELDGTLVPIPEGIPVGAKTKVGGQVYEFKSDSKLHLVEG